jgi:hypothetical protein
MLFSDAREFSSLWYQFLKYAYYSLNLQVSDKTGTVTPVQSSAEKNNIV